MATGFRRLALFVSVVLVVALTGPPTAARAAAGTISTSAQGLYGNVKLLSLVTVPVSSGEVDWTTGGATQTRQTASLPVLNLIDTGAVNATAAPVTGGGRAASSVAGLNVLGAVTVDAVSTSCRMTPAELTGGMDAANLKIGGAPVNPAVGLAVTVPGVLNATVDARTATWNSTTGRLDYTVRGLTLGLLGGTLSGVAGGTIVAAESACSGIVRLGTVSTVARTVTPGTTATPAVTVTNTGDVATPNTVIRIPAPPAGWTPGTATTTGGGTCVNGATYITCTGVTVPGGGNVVVNLPVTLAASGASAADWKPTGTQITAVSTPVAAVPDTTISIAGSGTLATAGPPQTTGGTVTVNAMSVAAGKTNTTTVTVANQGPSDATGATVTIPIGNRPAGVSVQAATYGGNPCSLSATTITCTGVTVPAGGSAAVAIRAAATTTTPPLTTWDLANVSTTLNGTAVSGGGRLLTVSDPDVNFDNGLTLTAATAVPGGPVATPTLRIRNAGIVAATNTTVTVSAPPAGYTPGPVTTTGGGTCTTTNGIRCTGVTVPAMGTVTVSMPVRLASPVTANWSGTADATSGDSTGTVTGPIVTANPEWTLGITSSGPAPRTVRPGQPTTMTVRVDDLGPSDAAASSFVVVAPGSTEFGPLTGTAAQLCQPLSLPGLLRCTVTLAADDPELVLALPLTVSAQADTSAPLSPRGCVSRNDDLDCADTDDVALAAVQLRTPIAGRITVAPVKTTVVPGDEGTALVRLTSSQDEDDLVVTVPTGALPAGFTVSGADVAGTPCTTTNNEVRCTGVDLTAGQDRDVQIRVRLASSAVPPQAWTATGIVVGDGTETLSRDGLLAEAGVVTYNLDAAVTGPPDNTVEPDTATTMRVVVTNNGPSDAAPATFRVRAWGSTVFQSPLPGICSSVSAAEITCTAPLTAGSSTPPLDLSVKVDNLTNAVTRLDGACVDFDLAPGCGSADRAGPPLLLKVPFDQQVALSLTPATVTPGDSGTAVAGVRGLHGSQGALTVRVPLAGLPAELSVTAVAAPGATCQLAGGFATCTGVGVTNGAETPVRLTVEATAAAAPGISWTATGVEVDNGVDPAVTADGQLAVTGAPVHPLRVTVTGPATPLQAGQTGTLDVTVDNLGPSDHPAATVWFKAPVSTTFGTPLPAGCTATTGVYLTCTTAIPVAQSPARLLIPVTVDAGTPTSSGPLGGGCADLDNNNLCDPGEPVIPAVLLASSLAERLTVTGVPATIVPGDSGTARVRLRSDRREDDLSVTVPANLPAGFTVGGGSFPGAVCTRNAADVTCTGVDLTAGTDADVLIDVTLADSVAAGQTWTATGITVEAGNDPATADATLAVAGTPQYAVTATVTGPPDGTVAPGQSTTLTLIARNTGRSAAPATTFTVSAPSATTFVAPMPALCTLTSTTLVTCTATLGANASTPPQVLPLLVDPAADPFVPHQGCVDADGNPGCGGIGDQTYELVLDVPLDQQIALGVTTGTITPGASDTGSVTVRARHGDLTGVTVTIPAGPLPAGLTLDAVTAPTGATCTSGPAEIRCTGVDVPDQTTAVIGLRVSAGAAATPGTAWDVTGVTAAHGGKQTSADGRPAVVGAPVHPIEVTVTPPAAPIEPGRSGTFQLAVDNLGPSDHPGAGFGVLAPSGTRFGTPLPGACTATTQVRLSCTVAVTAAQPPVVLTVPLTVDPGTPPGGPRTGGCVDAGNDGVCDPGDPGLDDVYVGTPFDQQVSISTVPVSVSPGRTGTAEVVVTGDRDLSGLTVVIPLTGKPAAVTAAAPAGCTLTTAEIRCTGIAVPAGRAASVEVPVTVTGSATAGDTWTATGITVTNAAGDVATGGGALVSTGAAVYRLTAAVTGPAPDTVLPGDTATLRATVGNAGPSDAANAWVTVRAPFRTTFGSPLPAGCTAGPDTVLTCPVTLPVNGTPLVWDIPVVVPADADPAADLTGGCLDLNGDGACGGTADVVLPDIDLRAPLDDVITVAADRPAAVPGGPAVTATVTVTSAEARSGLTISLDTAGRPAGTTIGNPSCPLIGTVITCSGVDLAAGAGYPVTMSVTAQPDAAPATWTTPVTTRQGAQITSDDVDVATVAAPVAALDVTVTPPAAGTLLPGGTADLSVTVGNDGPSVLRDARVAFRAPGATTFGTLQAPAIPACTRDSDVLVTCTFTLGVEQRTFALPIVLDASAPAGAPTGGGCVDRNTNGTCDPGEPALPPVQVGTPLSGQVTAATDPAVITPGRPGTGEIVLSSTPGVTGLAVTVPRAAPPGFTITGAGPCRLDPDVITCTGVSVPAGGSTRLPITVSTGAGLAAGVVWTASGITVTDSGGGSYQFNGEIARTGDPVTSVTFTAYAPPEPVMAGSEVATTFTVANAGPSSAYAYATSVFAPSHTTFRPLPPETAQVCTPAAAGTRLDCRFDVPAGSSTEYQARTRIADDASPADPPAGGCVDGSRNGRCGDAGDTPWPTSPMRRTVEQAVTFSAGNPVITPGTGGPGTITVTSADARTVTVRIPAADLPTGVTAGSAAWDNTACTPDGRDFVCAITFAAPGTRDIVIGLSVAPTAAPGATWTPMVVVTSEGRLTSHRVDAMTVGAARAPLTVTVAGPEPGTLLPGGTGDLTVTVDNGGPSAANGVPLGFTAPDGTTFEVPAVGYCTRTAPDRTGCTVTVAANARLVFVLRILVPSSTAPGSTLRGGCADVDNDRTCTRPPDTLVGDIVLGSPLSAQVQVGTDGGTVTPGQIGFGLVTVTATRALNGLTLTVPTTALPPGFTVTGAVGPAGSQCTIGSPIRCTGVSLSAGTSTALTIGVRATSNVAAGTAWAATGITLTAAGPPAESRTARGSGTLVTAGAPQSALAVTVTGPTGTVRAADTTAMTVTVTNPGPSDAVRVAATVVAPALTTFGALSGQAAADCVRTSDVLLTCTINQAVGAAALTWVLPLLVSSTAVEGDRISGGCVSRNADSDCADPVDVAGPVFSVGRPLTETTTLGFEDVVVRPGSSGTAAVTVESTSDYPGVTLTVPLAGLPDGFAVTSAGDGCTLTATAVVCAGLELTAGEPVRAELTVAVAASAADGAAWTPAGVRLVSDDDPGNVLTGSGLLVATTAGTPDVSVVVGTPSVRNPAAGQTTVLPVTLSNGGTGDARPYRLVLILPAGTTHGALPAGCRETGVRQVGCDVALPAGDSTTLSFPLVLDAGLITGTELTGGCVDLGRDGACGGDLALPALTVADPDVDLAIEYLDPAPSAVKGGTIRIGLPYTNTGNTSASGVVFTIDPPAGVTLVSADILLDAVAAGFAQVAAVRAQAGPDESQTVPATCAADPAGDANAVRCTGPEAPVGANSQLWLTLRIGAGAAPGTRPLSVTISTTSPEGVTVNNTATARLTVEGNPVTPSPAPKPSRGNTPAPGNHHVDHGDNRGPGGLPKTGQNVIGLTVLSVLLVLAGTAARIAARKRRRLPSG